MFEKQNGKAVVQYIQLKDKTTWKVEFFGSDPKVRLLREASPLTRSGSHHQFLHRSMLEYFFSRTVVGPRPPEHENEFTPQPSSDSSDIHSFDPECPLFTRNLLEEPSVMQFLSERVQENLSFKDRLLDIVEKSKTDASVALAAANAMTILVRAGVALHRHDFRGIRIPGADLSGGQFDSALFQGADVTNAYLGMCWMRNADFSNAHMDGVRFGELPAVADDDIIWTCACSPDGKTLVVGMRNGGISLYDSNTWEKIHWLEGHDHDTEALAFSPDSQRLASGGQDRKVQVWSCTEDEPLLTMEGHTDDVVSVAFSPCGNFFASASLDKTVRLWNSVTGEALFLLEGHTNSVNSVQFTPDGRRLISGSDDETIRFWDFETGASGDVLEPLSALTFPKMVS
ncbi:hypothetical protein BGZ97_012605 [Linnemannia gamsii]|uniref:WD40 repeat-like protein n=1 Tax=Linnemannia gamsii TaxID=64522 RepID=A0A9P6R5P8_9FUNG|nr:hypothetical protein BGZ97_012605 [Linnemannia gamsii]